MFEYQVENISECIDQYSKSNQDQLTIKVITVVIKQTVLHYIIFRHYNYQHHHCLVVG